MSAIGKCPWPGCGSDATVIIGRYVRCDNQDCMAEGPLAANPEAAITAWNRLATPEPAEVQGRIRWEPSAWAKGGYDIDMGRVEIGIAFPSDAGWTIRMSFADIPTIFAPTEAAARAALVAAVMEAIGDE